MMKRSLIVFLIALFIVLLGAMSMVSGYGFVQINPTEQHQTVEAGIAALLQLTAQPPEIQASIEAGFDMALTATRASESSEVADTGDTSNISLTATPEIVDELVMPKSDGFYLVGIDIQPGKWESDSSEQGCYWARRDSNGDTIDNHFGFAGGTITIQEDDFEIEFENCGTFHYVENLIPELQPDAYDPKEGGFYTIGIEIAPGRWRSTGQGDSCYWARLDENQKTLDNHFGNAGGTILLRTTDYELAIEDCGTLEYLGSE